MAHKEDLRITKTKAALTKAFFSMLNDMAFENITVNELCDRADVRRATFYKHFKDKGDFTAYLIKDVRFRFETEQWNNQENTALTAEYYLEYAKTIIHYIVEHESAIKKILESPLRHTFVNVFVEENLKDTKKRLELSASEGMRLVSSPGVVAGMLVSGTARCIVSWFEDESRCSPDILLQDISSFIAKVLS